MSSAGFFAFRANPILKEIDRLVERYHGIAHEEAYLEKTAILAAIHSYTRLYLTQHRDKEARKTAIAWLKNEARQDLRDLAPPVQPMTTREKLATAIQLHSRTPVEGGFHPTKPMHDQGYMLEAFGQTHLVADTLKEQFKRWVESQATSATNAGAAPPTNFWTWLELGGVAKLTRKVVYLSKEEREDYRVLVKPSGLSWATFGKALHTLGHNPSVGGFDAHSFIFVISRDKELYAGETIQGEFHHSSFLGGMPVLGAGQIQVDKGRLLKITNVSGHYRPDLDRHYNALLLMKIKGLDLTRIRSQAMGFHPEEASAAEHLNMLRRTGAKWRMDPAKKLEAFRQMTPARQAQHLKTMGGISEREYTADLEIQHQANVVFGQADSTDGLEFLPATPLD